MSVDAQPRDQSFTKALTEWMPAAPAQRGLRCEYLAFLEARGASALDRDGGEEHLTASCFIFTPDLSQTLLCFHKKGQFWVQLGGHIEADDPSVASAALREAHEESGIAALTLLDEVPFDLNRHALAAAFGRCTTHWDVGFVALTTRDTVPVVSGESDDVAWWPTDRMPPQLPDRFHERLHTVLRELRTRR